MQRLQSFFHNNIFLQFERQLITVTLLKMAIFQPSLTGFNRTLPLICKVHLLSWCVVCRLWREWILTKRLKLGHARCRTVLLWFQFLRDKLDDKIRRDPSNKICVRTFIDVWKLWSWFYEHRTQRLSRYKYGICKWANWACMTNLIKIIKQIINHWDPCIFCCRTDNPEFIAWSSAGSGCPLRTI